MRKFVVAVLAVSLCAVARAAAPAAPAAKAPAAAKPAAKSDGSVSRDQIRLLLKSNPSLVLDVLKENRKAVFEIVEQAAQEEQMKRQREAAEAEQREFEESFKNPKKAAITEKTRIRGNKDAKYTLVEYSDFQCPYCGQGFRTVEQLRKKYGNDLRFIFKNMPLPFHPQAMPAAKWFEAVALQSPEKSWQFHDAMFEHQDQLGEDYFKKTVKDLGLDVDKAAKDAQSQAVADKIEADVKEGKTLGFSGTPGFLLNGIPVKGAYPAEHFDEIVARLDKDAKK